MFVQYKRNAYKPNLSKLQSKHVSNCSDICRICVYLSLRKGRGHDAEAKYLWVPVWCITVILCSLGRTHQQSQNSTCHKQCVCSIPPQCYQCFLLHCKYILNVTKRRSHYSWIEWNHSFLHYILFSNVCVSLFLLLLEKRNQHKQ